jgi:hypothetical protein
MSDAVIFNSDFKSFEAATPFLQNLNNPTIYIPEDNVNFLDIKALSPWPIYSLSEYSEHFRTYCLHDIEVKGDNVFKLNYKKCNGSKQEEVAYLKFYEECKITKFGKIEQKAIHVPRKKLIFKKFVYKNNKFKWFGCKQFKSFIKPLNIDNYVLSTGGIGDALLAIAEAYKSNSTIVFAASHPNTKNIIESLISLFNLNHIVLEGNFCTTLKDEFYFWKYQHNCVSTTHIPDNLHHLDWKNIEKYESRITNVLDVQNIIGKIENNATIISPTASMNPSYVGFEKGTKKRNRCITKAQLYALVEKIEGEIYILCNLEQIKIYGIPKYTKWLSFEGIEDEKGFNTHPIKECLQIINGCKKILSVDTWLKTYGHYANIPTILFETNYDNEYYPLFSIDAGDCIFLNPKIWNLQITTIEKYLEEIK